MLPVRKAIIPVAGLGTRFLPATKAQPKEMLPIVDKPVIQYVVEEAVRAGLSSITFITGRGKQAIENHFDSAYELEQTLSLRHRQDDLDLIRKVSALARFAYVRQGEPLGLGHAVLCAQEMVHAEPFALLLGDDVFSEEAPAIQSLLETFARTRKSVVGVQEVPRAHCSRYGIINAPQDSTGGWNVREIIEKPSPAQAPSNWAVVGRYVLTPDIFQHLTALEPGAGGEYQLTDALAILAAKGELVAAPIPSKRYDTGNKLDYLKANIEFALGRADLGSDLKTYLQNLMATLGMPPSATPFQ
jgi:UTP--glucose-1-phosphate uridylyltransferase